MKYLLLVVSLLAMISVVDACVPEDAQTVGLQQAPTVAYYVDGDLRASCQCAPYFVENSDLTQAPQVRRQIWFPGKNIIRAIKARRAQRLVEQQSVGSCPNGSVNP